MRHLFIATVQVVVEVDEDTYNLGHLDDVASDYIAETLRDAFRDWAYLKVDGQYLYPVDLEMNPATYAEGDFLGGNET